MEFNKIFAALLMAGIIAMVAGFVSKTVTHKEVPAESAYIIEVADAPAGTGKPAAPQGPDPIADLLASADLVKGKKLSKACTACHSFDKGGMNRVGPNLWNVVNAKQAGVSGFSYSKALSAKGAQWTTEELNTFLWKPKRYAPGTKMSYIGMKKTKDRAALIAWLQSLSD